jgi:putative membrane protein
VEHPVNANQTWTRFLKGQSAMMYGYGFSWIGGVIMMIFWIVILVGIIWGAAYFMQNVSQHSSAAVHGETPLELLKRRYAAGEINREQFEEMKRALGV